MTRPIIDKYDTCFLIQDIDGTLYKLPINVLGDIIVLKDEENDKINSLIDTIYSLSAMILEISTDFVQDHYSMEELSTIFELKSDVEFLSVDKTILVENDVERFLKDSDLILKDDADAMYDDEEQDADNVFDNIETETDAYEVEDDEDDEDNEDDDNNDAGD